MTTTLDDIVAGVSVTGVDPAGPVAVVAVEWHGSQAITLTYRSQQGQVQEQMLFRSDEGTFEVVDGTQRRWSFDADGRLFRLAAEARRIQLAHLFDPYIALTSSQVRPLPHQIEAVYGEMLPRLPLRFLLADDPGAGKTIMAGLYIKELMIRGDVERCLIVAPGSLVNQWQDELWDKFGLQFEVVTKDLIDNPTTDEVFAGKPRLIARVDQLARREELVEQLGHSDWDLAIVDEAHRMSAHYYSSEVKKTKRYELGEALSRSARHFLLMTATPHAGKEEDFQLFMALLDADQFEGRFRDGVHAVDPSRLMRRMVKEKLLTFEGKPLFPERRAYTVQYDLSPPEMALYDEVTEYVREQMNRADRLMAEGQGRRGNTVGFALTLLQRRLASSPEAIYQSLSRRRKRLEQRIIEERQAVRAVALGMSPQEERLSQLLSFDDATEMDDWDDLDGTEREDLEVEVIDAATAAQTVAELELEIATLRQLERLALSLRGRGVDAKWVQLSGLLGDAPEMFGPDGSRRKLIIFTEHRDTLNYLVDRLRTYLGSQDAVVHISGGTTRDERRVIQQRFTQDKDCLILVATDAAGEGINLQRAHLVINYDLPWNPNRIEQRFGRVHRIGQQDVCHMWNLVAADTREAQVYLRLFDKIEEQRRAYQGQVFDVLGQALSGSELRRLLIEAIRYGERDDIKAQIDRVIDGEVAERVREAIEEAPLAQETMSVAEVDRIRVDMEEAEARRLQPHYVHSFFEAAFAELGGRMVRREPGRFEITYVPETIQRRDRRIGSGTPVADRYERVTFERELVALAGKTNAELLTPGHPIVRAVVDLTLEKHRHLFTQGAMLVDDATGDSRPRVLVMLEHSIADARPSQTAPHTVVSRRYEFVEVNEDGEAVSVGYAPYLDYRPASVEERDRARASTGGNWFGFDVEQIGTKHAIGVSIPEHMALVRNHTEDRVDETLAAVRSRLTREMNYWDYRAIELQERLEAGKTPRVNVELARRRANALAARLEERTTELEQERALRALPPVVVGGALIVPAQMLAAEGTADFSVSGRDEVERRAVQAVIATERALGWNPEDMNLVERNHPGWDITSTRPRRGDEPAGLKHIEVKGRIRGASTVTVTRNEILHSLNEPDRYVLALVEVMPDEGEHVRYLERPFTNVRKDFLFDVTSVNYDWKDLWSRAEEPHAQSK